MRKLLTLATLLSAAVVTQGELISPTGVALGPGNSATTALDTEGGWQTVNAFNGTGLPANFTVSDVHTASHFFNTGRALSDGASYPLTDTGDGYLASFIFDLGGTYTVSGLALWNSNEDDIRGDFTRTEAQRNQLDRSIKSAEFFSSQNGTTWTSVGTFSFTQESWDWNQYASSVTDVSAQVKSFTAVADVTHIRMDAVNYGDVRIVQFNEIAFEAVPEPGTIGLIALFGGTVLFIRRRFMI